MSGTSEGPAVAAAPDRSPVMSHAATVPHRAAFAAAPLALAVVDHQGLVIDANRAFHSLFGTHTAEDGPGGSVESGGSAGPVAHHPNSPAPEARSDSAADADTPGGRAGTHRTPARRLVAAELLDLASDNRTWQAYREVLRGAQTRLRCTRRFKHSDGHSLWAQVSVSPLSGGEEPGVALVSVTDISARRDLQARLRHLQMHDPVTRLPNRALFFERVTAALETSGYADLGTGRIGLCYLDIDGFKAVNDTLGHRVGDQLLAAVAERLTRCADRTGYTRSGVPLVARLGGDEFALLVEESTGTEQLADLAQSVLSAVQEPFELGGQRLAVSASIGVVERPAEGTTATELMQAADTTLYWAKADGKSRWTLFDPERNAHRMTRQALSSTLRPAVDREEFVLEYQPLVGLGDGVLHGVEALVRWRHPQFGLLTPNRFISLAEEDGSIVPLGRWILRTACRQARRWQLEHPDTPPVYVSVNVAVRQVWDSDLVADVEQILAETRLPSHLLQLELTESAVMGSTGRPLETLRALRDRGVRIAIDDFGTGYSNLAYLSRLPVSALKLDGSFVRGFRYPDHTDPTDDAVPNPADEVVVEAMVQLAHRLGLTVTAECVETADQAARLHRVGCDTGQGWLYSRSVAPERIGQMLGAGARLKV
ncbi:bifunctional diguanylate cyclase/phosphodiesterase [Streptomyces sp. NA04227]|uniref:putative bifunctional diguanylate cyclase/phosphodiesterase n=1 Tax=Streptomyces sp. NA04227 TaxID=2742136 RepID=UPI0020CA9668|nr:EAL domain-containing protein [Streptomyces sp. NA04227]